MILTSKQKIIWADVTGNPVPVSLAGLARQDVNGQLVTVAPVKPNYTKALTLCGESKQ